MKKLIVALFLFASTAVMADQGDVWLQFSTVGEHLENNNKANNFTPGVAIFYEVFDDVSVGIGENRNSYQHTKRNINGKYTYPTLWSTSGYLDYRFWHNDLWETHLGYQEGNHYYNASPSGTLVPGLEAFVYSNVCRKFSSETNWKGCLQVSAWHNNPGPGIDEFVSFKIQYNFGDPTNHD